jgi:hypothetical protein
MDPIIRVRRAEFVRRAIDVLANHGSANAPGSGKAIADYLKAHIEDYGDIGEVRRWLKNIDGALRSFREELRAIQS